MIYLGPLSAERNLSLKTYDLPGLNLWSTSFFDILFLFFFVFSSHVLFFSFFFSLCFSLFSVFSSSSCFFLSCFLVFFIFFSSLFFFLFFFLLFLCFNLKQKKKKKEGRKTKRKRMKKRKRKKGRKIKEKKGKKRNKAKKGNKPWKIRFFFVFPFSDGAHVSPGWLWRERPPQQPRRGKYEPLEYSNDHALWGMCCWGSQRRVFTGLGNRMAPQLTPTVRMRPKTMPLRRATRWRTTPPWASFRIIFCLKDNLLFFDNPYFPPKNNLKNKGFSCFLGIILCT